MGASGRFGRYRGNFASLTSLILQLQREERAAQDRAIAEAYNNGGLYQGKPVTDDVMLHHLLLRRNDLTKDDPNYDLWNDQVVQLRFRIGEEKVALRYKQGKVGAGTVANYYKEQLHHIPKDSAFYRTVAGRAADWAKAAAAQARANARGHGGGGGGGRGRGGRRGATGVMAAAQKAQDKVVKIWGDYSSIDAIVTEAAKRAGIIAGNQTLTDADAQDIEALFASGIPYKGSTITLDDWRHASVAAYKAFDQQIAINKSIHRGVKELTSQKNKFLNQNLIRINVIDERAAYESARANWLQATRDESDPSAVHTANEEYAKALEHIRDVAMKSSGSGVNKVDPEFIGGLNNEIHAVRDGKATGPTVTDLQHTSGEGIVTEDAASSAKNTTDLYHHLDLLASGRGYYGQSEPGGKLGVIEYAPGSEQDPFGRHGLAEDSQIAIVMIDGVPKQVVLKGAVVRAVGAIGQSLDSSGVKAKGDLPKWADAPVDIHGMDQAAANAYLNRGEYAKDQQPIAGYVYTQPDGSHVYGVRDPVTGKQTFTTEDPFTNGAVSDGKGGYITIGSTTFDQTGAVVVDPTSVYKPNVAPGTHIVVGSGITADDLRALASSDPANADFYNIEAGNLPHDKDWKPPEPTYGTIGKQVSSSRYGGKQPDILGDVAASPLGQAVAQTAAAIAEQLRGVTLPGHPPPPSIAAFGENRIHTGVAPPTPSARYGAPPPVPKPRATVKPPAPKAPAPKPKPPAPKPPAPKPPEPTYGTGGPQPSASRYGPAPTPAPTPSWRPNTRL